MSERWKYQIKTGGFWAVIMTVIVVVFDLNETPLYEQITSFQFYFRLVFFLLMGIFILGYFTWRNKKF